ncbi:hypothetical protein X798_03545 [Onchocerca flexuosa]|uniref:Uncharacterized protein n=1 Tax=Onchocerca flexuosa TaxID=387005 RepID=A0A238BWK4_9BILA|nr:hypothetical protein X798_03545 [Onchocerca flexuosa]
MTTKGIPIKSNYLEEKIDETEDGEEILSRTHQLENCPNFSGRNEENGKRKNEEEMVDMGRRLRKELLNIRTSRKQLEDYFLQVAAIIEFQKGTGNSHFFGDFSGINSARIEFIDISAKLKAMDLTSTFLHGSKIDVHFFFFLVEKYSQD